jgi:transketolase
MLQRKGCAVRVVSMVSWELFEAQDEEYREQVLPKKAGRRLAVEAALPMGWERFVGCRGRVIGVDGFGSSAPGEVLMEKTGFSVANIVRRAAELLKE